MTVGGTIIRSNQVGTVILPLINGIQLTLSNIAFVTECDSNLISLGHLQETDISYHNHSEQILLRQVGETIGSATRKKNPFILNTQTSSRKRMLVKGQSRPTYLLSKNPQIKLWHRRLRHASNARVMEISKLDNEINITIEDDLLTENLSSDSGMDDKDRCKDMGQTLNANNKHERLSPLMAIINNPDNSEIKKLWDSYIKSKHTKIVRHKKMTPTTRKLQEIHANLWESHDSSSLSGKTYIGLLLDKFIQKSWILLLKSKDELFNAFKLWLSCTEEASGKKLGCL